MDLVRFGLFTIGHAWMSDYGDPQGSKADLETVLKYVTNYSLMKGILRYIMLYLRKSILQCCYAQVITMIECTDFHVENDQSVPLHSYKLIAELQAKAGENENPLMIRIETNAGHGAGKSTQQRVC